MQYLAEGAGVHLLLANFFDFLFMYS